MLVQKEGKQKGKMICGEKYEELFEYIRDIVTLLNDTGSSFDIELVDELESMYGADYIDTTYKHKELLECVLDIAKMTQKYYKGHRVITEEIEYMISQIE